MLRKYLQYAQGNDQIPLSVKGSTGKDDHVKLLYWGYSFMYSTGDETSSRPGWREKICREGNVEEVNSTGELSGVCWGKD